MTDPDSAQPTLPSSSFRATTKNGYPLDEVASTIQKAIRRGDEKIALWFAYELFPNYVNYLFKRLLVVSAEDVAEPMATTIVMSMREAFFQVNEKKTQEQYKSRMFIAKAVTYLCRAEKSREGDHISYWVDGIQKSGKLPKVPEYAFDVHTRKGKQAGKTKAIFFVDEQEALNIKGRDDFYKLLPKNV